VGVRQLPHLELALGDETFGGGLNNAVKDNDAKFPADWRLSYRACPAKD
jgi:hypothetical protein